MPFTHKQVILLSGSSAASLLFYDAKKIPLLNTPLSQNFRCIPQESQYATVFDDQGLSWQVLAIEYET